jgi:CRP/FNR family cyclic AMP-dependent transcriptional regulator
MSDNSNEKALFEDFSDNEIKEVLNYTQAYKFNKGDFLFKEGENTKSLYIIFSGNVEISALNSKGERVSFPFSGNGTVLGEIAFLDGRDRTASAQALDVLEAIEITPSNFQRMEIEKPQLAIKFLKELGRIVAERLRWADEVLVEVIEN